MTFEGKDAITTLQGDHVEVSRGPAAAFVAIKHIGTNGGGFFGANSAHPLENPTYFSISPTSFTVDFPTNASSFIQDFCITANGVHSDVEVVVMQMTPAIPGFDAQYRIIYKNIGNQIENGEVTLKYFDDIFDFVSSSIVFDSQTFSGIESTLHWNYTNLLPFETRTIDFVLKFIFTISLLPFKTV